MQYDTTELQQQTILLAKPTRFLLCKKLCSSLKHRCFQPEDVVFSARFLENTMKILENRCYSCQTYRCWVSQGFLRVSNLFLPSKIGSKHCIVEILKHGFHRFLRRISHLVEIIDVLDNSKNY